MCSIITYVPPGRKTFFIKFASVNQTQQELLFSLKNNSKKNDNSDVVDKNKMWIFSLFVPTHGINNYQFISGKGFFFPSRRHWYHWVLIFCKWM